MTHYFLVRFVVGLLTACAVVGAAYPLTAVAQEADESKFLHVLIVADTVDLGIGESVTKDVEMLKELFEDGIPESKRKITILADDYLTEAFLFKTIADLQVEADDSLLLYYCGHGVIDQEDKHAFRLSTGIVPRSQVLEAMQQKNPRLCLLISDCCAILELPIRARFGPHFKTINSELIRYLFFQPQGLVNINSAKSGEVALCSDFEGGFFTSRFCQLFLLPTSDLVQSQNGVPTWSSVADKITELLIPTEMEIQLSQNRGANPYLLEIEKSRGIRVFRDKKTPNIPVQHPVVFSSPPKTSDAVFPTGSNTLGFTYHIIAGEAIQIDDVVSGSMAFWSGLETGDSILGFEEQRFEIRETPDGALLTQPTKARASRLDQDFNFEEFLLCNSPIGIRMPNLTPGWVKAVVRKRSGEIVRNLPISTTKMPPKTDTEQLTPEESEALLIPYFERLYPL